jgi:hypothetical protein
MQQLILKKNLSENKMKALIEFLRNWDIEAEFKPITKISSNDKKDFTLSVGIWEDSDINPEALRIQAWKK